MFEKKIERGFGRKSYFCSKSYQKKQRKTTTYMHTLNYFLLVCFLIFWAEIKCAGACCSTQTAPKLVQNSIQQGLRAHCPKLLTNSFSSL